MAPNQCLVIEDTTGGVIAAVDAGKTASGFAADLIAAPVRKGLRRASFAFDGNEVEAILHRLCNGS